MWAATLLRVLSIASIMKTILKAQTPITQCADNSPLPISYSNNCTKFACCHVPGDIFVIDIDFTITQHTTSLYLQLRGVSSDNIDEEDKYPPPEPDGCQSLVGTSSCPVEAGKTVQYRSTYIVLTFPVQTFHFIEFRMVNQNNETQACFVQVMDIQLPGGTCDQTCN